VALARITAVVGSARQCTAVHGSVAAAVVAAGVTTGRRQRWWRRWVMVARDGDRGNSNGRRQCDGSDNADSSGRG